MKDYECKNCEHCWKEEDHSTAEYRLGLICPECNFAQKENIVAQGEWDGEMIWRPKTTYELFNERLT